jgi:hypothetical protein
MIPLYTTEEFILAKSSTKLPCKCVNCYNIFYKDKRTINKAIKNIDGHNGNFCSNNCKVQFNGIGEKKVFCSNCFIEFLKTPSEIKKSKNNFCSKSCATTYNNKHKTTGNRRSKLEIYLEEQLKSLYTNLHIDYNKKDTISSELDIYIPSLKLAFELNGIFHYEPIYGLNKLNQIQSNDISKSKACFDKHIDLCIIDTSGLKYFKPTNAQKYLDIIVNIINQRTLLLTS